MFLESCRGQCTRSIRSILISISITVYCPVTSPPASRTRRQQSVRKAVRRTGGHNCVTRASCALAAFGKTHKRHGRVGRLVRDERVKQRGSGASVSRAMNPSAGLTTRSGLAVGAVERTKRLAAAADTEVDHRPPCVSCYVCTHAWHSVPLQLDFDTYAFPSLSLDRVIVASGAPLRRSHRLAALRDKCKPSDSKIRGAEDGDDDDDNASDSDHGDPPDASDIGLHDAPYWSRAMTVPAGLHRHTSGLQPGISSALSHAAAICASVNTTRKQCAVWSVTRLVVVRL